MKVMLLNGSPHEKGCTYTALEEVQRELKKCGVDSEILHVGHEDIHGCIGCGYCGREGRCVFDDAVDRIGARLDEFDGYVFGTPVYYAGISGQLKSFMDRLFYAYKNHMQYKPAAAVVSARRGGCVSTFDDINRFFTVSCFQNDISFLTQEILDQLTHSALIVNYQYLYTIHMRPPVISISCCILTNIYVINVNFNREIYLFLFFFSTTG